MRFQRLAAAPAATEALLGLMWESTKTNVVSKHQTAVANVPVLERQKNARMLQHFGHGQSVITLIAQDNTFDLQVAR